MSERLMCIAEKIIGLSPFFMTIPQKPSSGRFLNIRSLSSVLNIALNSLCGVEASSGALKSRKSTTPRSLSR